MSGSPGPAEAVPALTIVLPPLSSVKTSGTPSSLTSASMVWLMPEPLMRTVIVWLLAVITVLRTVSVSVLPSALTALIVNSALLVSPFSVAVVPEMMMFCPATKPSAIQLPEARVIVHPDSWRWGPSERFSWREHEGRGYWRSDDWVEW